MLRSRRIPTVPILNTRLAFKDVLWDATGFHAPSVRTKERLLVRFAEAAQRFAGIATGLQSLCKRHLDFDLTIPQIESSGVQMAILPYPAALADCERRIEAAIDALTAALNDSPIGRVEWLDNDTVRFSYREVKRSFGVFDRTLTRERHEHELVHARQHRLPVKNLLIPAGGNAVIAAIPTPVLPYTRVITGTEIRKGCVAEGQRLEPTAVGRFFDRASAAAVAAWDRGVSAAKSIGKQVPAALGTVASSRPIAHFDPAIVVGEFCFFGWEIDE